MARAIPYAAAIDWIAGNDDTEWVAEEEDCPSVTAALVADIYGKTEAVVRADLIRALKRAGRR